jgi:DNA-binding MarR family transcriptional regulator
VLTSPADDWVPPEARTHAGHLLRRALQTHTELWASAVGSELTPPQYAVLAAVIANPGIDQRTLGHLVSLDKSTAADVVRRLVERGHLTRDRAADDGRRDTMFVTTSGLELVKTVVAAVNRVNDVLISPLTPAEGRRFLKLLERVAYRDR